MCPHCPSTFASMQMLGKHVERQHAELNENNEERLGPPVFPQRIMNDDEKKIMEDEYTGGSSPFIRRA